MSVIICQSCDMKGRGGSSSQRVGGSETLESLRDYVVGDEPNWTSSRSRFQILCSIPQTSAHKIAFGGWMFLLGFLTHLLCRACPWEGLRFQGFWRPKTVDTQNTLKRHSGDTLETLGGHSGDTLETLSAWYFRKGTPSRGLRLQFLGRWSAGGGPCCPGASGSQPPPPPALALADPGAASHPPPDAPQNPLLFTCARVTPLKCSRQQTRCVDLGKMRTSQKSLEFFFFFYITKGRGLSQCADAVSRTRPKEPV